MKNLKRKVQNAVDLYKKAFQTEYNTVVIQIKERQSKQKNEYGEVVDEDGRTHAVQRKLFEVSEKLYTIVMGNLTDEEILLTESKEYALWFVKEFPQFSTTKNE